MNDTKTGLYDVKKRSYYSRNGGSGGYIDINMAMLNATPILIECFTGSSSNQCILGLTGDNEKVFGWKNNPITVLLLPDHEYPLDINIYAEDSVNYYVILTMMRHANNTLFWTTL